MSRRSPITIGILDLVFITKDTGGIVEAVDFEDHDAGAFFHALDGDVSGLASDDDISHAAVELGPSSSTALLIGPDLGATPFVEALRASGAVLIEGSRNPPRPDRSRTRCGGLNPSTRREGRACCDVDHWPEQPSRRPMSSALRRG